MEQQRTFETELMDLINKHSKKNESNTPDFILTQYLLDCLAAYNKAVNGRKKWSENHSILVK